VIVIILLSIATAALFAMLAVELGRLAIGEFRVPRPPLGPLRAPGGRITLPPERRQAPPASEEPAAPAGEDVEQRVRDRLYGERIGALRRAPNLNG
jgi:hypothetical protein